MAEESRGGRNRRRYFRRKGGDKSQTSAAGPAQQQPVPPPVSGRDEGAAVDRRARVGRRKRRGRNRRSGEARVDAVATSVERDIDYQPPASVYIYTYVVHPPSGGAYEFRSEHFSKVGRTLDDYDIDIESLFSPPDKEARRRLLEQAFADFDYGEPEAPPPESAEPVVYPLLGDGGAAAPVATGETPLGAASAAASTEPGEVSESGSDAQAPDAV